MVTTKDFAVQELEQFAPRLRRDLVFVPQRFGRHWQYVVEDRLQSAFYRIGVAEYTFLSMLDGRTTIGEILRRMAAALPRQSFNWQDAASVCDWLLEHGLIEGDFRDEDSEQPGSSRRRYVHPLVQRVPLCHPQRFFARCTPWLGWLFSAPMAVVYLLVLAAAGYGAMTGWDALASASRGVLAPDRWWRLALVWLVLKAIHELSHGVVATRHGATVREAGLVLILLAPIAYVDVTSAWRLRSRWRRVLISAAGVLAETFLAAVAVLLALATDDPLARNLSLEVALLAGAGTLLFNLNPLMQFDGYYLLCDLAGMSNLASDARRLWRGVLRRVFLGLPAAPPAGSRGRRAVLALYGAAAAAWRLFVCVCLLAAAAALLHGLGRLLAAAAAVAWFVLPVIRFAKSALGGPSWQRPNWFRLAWTSAASAAAVGAVLLAPWSGRVCAPAIVDYAPLTLIRAAAPGFVEAVHVADGQRVQAGQVVAVLRNEELRAQCQELALEVRRIELDCQRLQHAQQMAEYQAARERLAAARQRYQEKRRQVRQLVLRAARDGWVLTRSLAAREGTYLKEGDVLLAIGDQRRKELRLSIDQDDVQSFERHMGAEVRFRLSGWPDGQAVLSAIEPRGSTRPADPELCAPYGGPLAVKSPPATSPRPPTELELLTPRFTATALLTAQQSQTLRCGLRGTVWFCDQQTSLGRAVHRALVRWFRQKLAPAS